MSIESFIENAHRKIYFSGKRILDIGCGDGTAIKMIADRYSPSAVIGIDNQLNTWWSLNPEEGVNWAVQNGDATNLAFEDESFDAVISCTAFEHIGDIPKALSEIKRVLRPNGRFYTTFCPIWTSMTGHHFHFWTPEWLDLIPPWGHLYLSPEEMHRHVEERAGGKVADEAVDFIYMSDCINRLPRRTYIDAIYNSGMNVLECEDIHVYNRRWSHPNPTHFPDFDRSILEKLTPEYAVSDLLVGGLNLLLSKCDHFTGIREDVIRCGICGNDYKYMASGFSYISEQGFRWTDGKQAILNFPPGGSDAGKTLQMTLSVWPFLYPSCKEQKVVASVAGKTLYKDAISSATTINFSIPPELRGEGAWSLQFDLPNAAAPADYNINGDTRKLALGFAEIRFQPA